MYAYKDLFIPTYICMCLIVYEEFDNVQVRFQTTFQMPPTLSTSILGTLNFLRRRTSFGQYVTMHASWQSMGLSWSATLVRPAVPSFNTVNLRSLHILHAISTVVKTLPDGDHLPVKGVQMHPRHTECSRTCISRALALLNEKDF